MNSGEGSVTPGSHMEKRLAHLAHQIGTRSCNSLCVWNDTRGGILYCKGRGKNDKMFSTDRRLFRRLYHYLHCVLKGCFLEVCLLKPPDRVRKILSLLLRLRSEFHLNFKFGPASRDNMHFVFVGRNNAERE